MLDVFPEFQLIQNMDLRNRSMACFEDGLETGNWKIKDMDDIPFTLLIPNCQINFRTHVQAVTQTAIASAKILSQHYQNHYTIDMDFVVAGGLLHDIGKIIRVSSGKSTLC